ncbi:hypothetical protein JTB14_021685 [Gonioctena quinquepunctata]|nr:hypothetical protein JTB14_021685 [Gonioctena quinquepunctata]
MDSQPCGLNAAIAYYIAKYLSKGEPTGVDIEIAHPIQQIQREESDISRKLIRICMKNLHERKVSAAECADHLCHIPLRDSSLTLENQTSGIECCNLTKLDMPLDIVVTSLKDMKNGLWNILIMIS